GRKVEVVDLADGDEIRAGHTRIQVRVEPTFELPAAPAGSPADTHPEIPVPPGWGTPQSAATALNELGGSAVLPTADAEPRVPAYRLRRRSGRGNRGVVSHARREADGLEVALKSILPGQADNPQVTTRFLREAEALGRLDHPNIVRFYEAGEAGGLLYFVMEYVAGTDVGKVLLELPRIEPRTAIRTTIQVLDALAHAHAR